ncbi:MAG: zinc-dependent metalloprotease [Bacteroidota bacterium]
MPRLLLLLLPFFYLTACSKRLPPVSSTPNSTPTIAERVAGLLAFAGYFPYWYEEQTGKIFLEVRQLEAPFLYVNALSAGLGSNDVGLDRGQLGDSRLVYFQRSGPRLLLVQPNQDFRALSDNADEQRSVAEAFAQSVLWGFKIELVEGQRILIDATDFFLRDAHAISRRLDATDQGRYRPDPSRSGIYLPACKNFVQNTEIEALLTFTGNPTGGYVRQVVPTPEAISLRLHHSFVQLPDDQYRPRGFDPRSGYLYIHYQDYASPIGSSLSKRWIQRHRLVKQDPGAARSEAVDPIVYYLDRGAPEPIRSALLEGASWWNQAFEAAGYRNAFRVEVLPEGVDPLDIRYNVIQWVHRSTRGWSYGSTVTDPRTGEIIKGHVSLGSLRVRQDFLIAQGLVQAYEAGEAVRPELLEMALARLRQLSAHEVGHTLGLAHNFAASTNGRASVMDYPHPYLSLGPDGQVDFSQAYDDKIGEWDKRAILYGYQDFPESEPEAAGLQQILDDTRALGLDYLSDQDARPPGGAHPRAHLWDNGRSPVEDLERLLEIRGRALEQFGLDNIAPQQPLADLEEVLVPLYLSHRYQVEAVAKLVGGVDYRYSSRGESDPQLRFVSREAQDRAFQALLTTLSPKMLALPERILQLIPPKPMGYRRGRESFASHTQPLLDPIHIAEGASQHVLRLLLHPARANRLLEQGVRDRSQAGWGQRLDQLVEFYWRSRETNPYWSSIQRAGAQLMLQEWFRLLRSDKAASEVKAIGTYQLGQLEEWLAQAESDDPAWTAHFAYARQLIQRFRQYPQEWEPAPQAQLPDGSPIGCGHGHFFHR